MRTTRGLRPGPQPGGGLRRADRPRPARAVRQLRRHGVRGRAPRAPVRREVLSSSLLSPWGRVRVRGRRSVQRPSHCVRRCEPPTSSRVCYYQSRVVVVVNQSRCHGACVRSFNDRRASFVGKAAAAPTPHLRQQQHATSCGRPVSTAGTCMRCARPRASHARSARCAASAARACTPTKRARAATTASTRTRAARIRSNCTSRPRTPRGSGTCVSSVVTTGCAARVRMAPDLPSPQKQQERESPPARHTLSSPVCSPSGRR